ncbi:YybS family protein [Peribacillus glennii]|uniref:DUF2232 domain-containing protein n=1 Tax=Peribacillus glennii TaxID=2303991 RepID=A0A372LC40_9BACI|nr:YybS family protein [Peribacillus glennii]RFU62493.1 DUF2232 domain-containing protein [Peribacillus glennii]
MNNGRKIAEGGALLALYSILLLLTVYFPLLGLPLFFFLPVPFILTAIKHDLGWSIGFLLVACGLSALFGTITAIPMALVTGATGVTIGALIRRNKPAYLVYVGAVLILIIGIVALYGAAAWFFDVDFIGDFISMLRDSVGKSLDMMTAMGQEVPEDFTKGINDWVDMLNTLLPALLVATSMVMAALIVLASNPFVKRFSEKKVSWPPLRELQLPKSLLWYYLITMVAGFFLRPEEDSYLYMVIANLLLILQLLMLLQGYSLLFFFSHIKGWAKAVPVIILVLSLFMPFFQAFIRIAGIVDLGFPIRDALRNKKQ